MTQTAANTISRQSRLQGEESTGIAFRPEVPGAVFVQSTPPPPSAHTETGMLASLQLFRPGVSKALKTVRYPRDSQVLSLGYTVTAADLATPGDWTAVVYNASLDTLTFNTDVTYPISNPVLTATVDIGFLNLILSKVFDAASISGHIESTSQRDLKLSYVALSQDVASLLKQGSVTSFHVGDFTSHGIGYRIKNLDTDPAYPMVSLGTAPLALRIGMRIDPASVKFEALGPLPLPDIRVKALSVELLVGFDGSVKPSCYADVHLSLDNLDLSDAVSSAVVDGINDLIHGDSSYAALFSPSGLRGYIDLFFKSFMRLGSRATSLGYAVQGQTLAVSYILQ